ncbi:MAG: response regulator [Mongoliitalea sp.]
MNYRIIIIDDHEIFSNGLRMILENRLPLKVVKSFCKGGEALDYLAFDGALDLVILDLNMPGMDGFTFLQKMQSIRPQQKVLVVSMHYTISHIEKCKELGASGFVKKDESLEKLLKVVTLLMQGKHFFDEPSENRQEIDVSKELKSQYKLSPTEIKIIGHLLDQKENKEIADAMNLSYLTIKTHRKNIYRKLGVHNIAGIVAIWKVVSERDKNIF